MLLDDDIDELLLKDDTLEFIDDRLDELEDETLVLLDVALDDVTDMDDMLLDVELIELLELDDAVLLVLLDDELDGCDETSDELLLMFPLALDELTAPEPPVHAAVNAEVSSNHAIQNR